MVSTIDCTSEGRSFRVGGFIVSGKVEGDDCWPILFEKVGASPIGADEVMASKLFLKAEDIEVLNAAAKLVKHMCEASAFLIFFRDNFDEVLDRSFPTKERIFLSGTFLTACEALKEAEARYFATSFCLASELLLLLLGYEKEAKVINAKRIHLICDKRVNFMPALHFFFAGTGLWDLTRRRWLNPVVQHSQQAMCVRRRSCPRVGTSNDKRSRFLLRIVGMAEE